MTDPVPNARRSPMEHERDLDDPIRTPAEALEAATTAILAESGEVAMRGEQFTVDDAVEAIRALASRIPPAPCRHPALALLDAAETEVEALRAALRSIDFMVQEAARAPATAERWLDRIQECALAALGDAP